MKLPVPPAGYDVGDQARMRGQVELADSQSLKRMTAEPFILLRRPDGVVGRLTVDNANALHFTPL
jgi:hypothetical protein